MSASREPSSSKSVFYISMSTKYSVGPNRENILENLFPDVSFIYYIDIEKAKKKKNG